MDPMAFFRKRAPRRIIGRYRAPAPSPRPPLATLVDEARMVAHAAVRMAVKNRIIVLAAGERRDFDPVLLRAFTRETLEQLAQQQRAAAEYERAGQHAIRRGPVLAGLAAALFLVFSRHDVRGLRALSATTRQKSAGVQSGASRAATCCSEPSVGRHAQRSSSRRSCRRRRFSSVESLTCNIAPIIVSPTVGR